MGRNIHSFSHNTQHGDLHPACYVYVVTLFGTTTYSYCITSALNVCNTHAYYLVLSIFPGMQYYSWELPRLIIYLKEYFKWDKVSLLCHSMGSIAGMRYACIFPNDVDFYIGIDSIIYDEYDLNLVVDKYPKLLEKGLIAQSRLDEEPPSYTLDELTKIWHHGTTKSVALNSVKYLLQRGVKPSKHDSNKYYFSRDSRLKYTLFNPEDKKFVEAIIKRLKTPTLYIKSIDSPFAFDAFSVEMREVIEKNNDKFECHFVPGTHHVHLNNPERIAPLIEFFLKKYNLDI